MEPTRRRYIELLGASAAVTALPIALGTAEGGSDSGVTTGRDGGTSDQPTTDRRLDFDRDDDGDIEFEDHQSTTRFESHGEDVDFRDDFLRCETDTPRGRTAFTRLGRGGSGTVLDLDVEAVDVETHVDVGGERVECEFDGETHNFTVEGAGTTFEDDGEDNGIEYRGRQFRFEMDGPDIEVDGALRFDYQGVNDIDFVDEEVLLRSDANQFECVTQFVRLDFDKRTGEFEALRVV